MAKKKKQKRARRRAKAKTKKKEKIKWSWVTHRDLENGMMQYECYTKKDPCPSGVVWGYGAGLPGWKKPIFIVMHSYTHPWAQRQGVRTRIRKEMLKTYKAIVTFAGTRSGAAWMKAVGYKKLRPWGMWIDEGKPKR